MSDAHPPHVAARIIPTPQNWKGSAAASLDSDCGLGLPPLDPRTMHSKGGDSSPRNARCRPLPESARKHHERLQLRRLITSMDRTSPNRRA